ncbi:Maf family protein [Alkaliphilus transvaalensis]|uniref:Maf family protein n=1 Tax=Alkaliphilus transvaalensis TaxID=114628 RepID=UPI00047C95A8|nr:Maf family protein [Alkaliphilus transvaalensis]
MTKLILASNSPRRKELLTNLGVKFDVVAKEVDEIKEVDYDPYKLACENAFRKAQAVLTDVNEESIIIAADTIVYHQGILGKPANEGEAYDMLKSLSATVHEVITAFAVVEYPSNKKILSSETTKVYFKELNHDEIMSYIRSGEPMDKAGAYGIQGKASLFVEKIEGDYFNVVGLPLFKIEETLRKEFEKSLLNY